MKPKLTIITPSFNQGHFIERTIRSVLDQGYENLEYLIVDGGSTDETVEIIERYEDRLAWWVSEPDEGQTDAINKGLRRATGDIVAYINSDDYYLPGAFEAAIARFAGSSTARWVVGACRFVQRRRRVRNVWVPRAAPAAPALVDARTRGACRRPRPSGGARCSTSLGPFREDMHYVFDTEHGLRLAYAGDHAAADRRGARRAGPPRRGEVVGPHARSQRSSGASWTSSAPSLEPSRAPVPERWTAR